MSLIRVENLKKEFRVHKSSGGMMNSVKGLFFSRGEVVNAVDDISFEIEKGEFVGYLGPNGAGKSTSIKMLTGILVPTSGDIVVGGITPYRDRKLNSKNIGVVFGQRTQLWWDLPPLDSYKLLGKIYRRPSKEIELKIDFLSELLELQEFIKSPVRKLSLGQKMRCELAAALLHSPEILYLDEPTIGLDVVAKDSIRAFLTRLNETEKTTIILTTHDLDDVEKLCKRVIVIDSGKIIHDSSIERLRKHFGNHRVLEVEYDEYCEFPLPENVTAVKSLGNRFFYQFNSDKIKAPELIKRILEHNSISDLSLVDVDIEEVIRKIYNVRANI